MKKALGMIEFKTVASGITATDMMLKTAEVEVVQASPVCPGKYLATIIGELSSVRAAIDAAEAYNSAMHMSGKCQVRTIKSILLKIIRIVRE